MFSTSIIGINNSNDIESGSASNMYKRTATYTNTNSNYSVKSSNNCGPNCCIKSGIWLLIMIICFPISFCDLYYGYTDNTCVSEPAGRLAINLKDYLLVYGLIGMSVIGLLSSMLFCLDINTFGSKNSNIDGCIVCGGAFLAIIFVLVTMFLIIWNIFGAIIFWCLTDTSKCSNSIYNYVFASLIIKLVFSLISILQIKKEKNK